MPTPQLPGFGDASAFTRWTKSIDYRLNLLFEKLNNVLANTGLSVPGPNVTQVDGSLNVVGNLNVSGSSTVSGSNGIQSSNFAHGATGWNLTGTQVEINTGAIGMSALVHPISFDGNGGALTNFATGTSSSVVLGSVSNTVPAGMTKMASFVVGNVTAVNSTASTDYIECRVGIVDPSSVNYTGNSMYQQTPAGAGGHVSASKYGLLSGLSGGQTVQHYISAWSSSAAWAANASNIADIQAIILWGA
jgi:hypothetical protein